MIINFIHKWTSKTKEMGKFKKIVNFKKEWGSKDKHDSLVTLIYEKSNQAGKFVTIMRLQVKKGYYIYNKNYF